MLTDTPVSQELAMTGEVTLDGSVLPIGGLQQKLHGAYRAGITLVVIPQDNVSDLPVRTPGSGNMRIVPCSTIRQVLNLITSEIGESSL
jgi:ATP-dependent Lon protease